MGKVKETACAWPNVSPDIDFSQALNANALLSTNGMVANSSQLNSKDSVIKELEQELLLLSQQMNNPNIQEQLDSVSEYISLLESQQMDFLETTGFTPSDSGNSSYPPTIDLCEDDIESNHHMISESDSSCHTSSSSSPLSSPLSSTPLPSMPASPRASMVIPVPPFHMSASNPHMYTPTFLPPPNSCVPALTPLSAGGYIANFVPPLAPSVTAHLPQSTPVSPFMPVQMQPFTTTVSNVSPAIASRQEKLERYRQKRLKRNFSRTVDPARRERAQSRTRDENGHFVSEKDQMKVDLNDVKTKLAASQEESKLLKDRLANMEKELAFLRRTAEQAKKSQEDLKKELQEQQTMNILLSDQKLLFSSVPINHLFNTTRSTADPNLVKAFQQKIDFKTIELNCTDSPHLDSKRMEEAREMNGVKQ